MKKDRVRTEQCLIKAIEELVIENGFEKLGVRAVAERAGVDKTLIYRYFGSLDGLIYECLKKQDFWSNVSIDIPESVDIKEYVKGLFKMQIHQLRSNEVLKRLLRWELSNNNAFITELRNKREENGLKRIETISEMTGIPIEDLAALSSIITGGICYLVMVGETCQYFNGIDITNDIGWEQLTQRIDKIIDLI